MKTAVISLIVFTLIALNTFAQDSPQWGLPEHAKARLGKGDVTRSVAYSPDGTRLAVATDIGVWLYDTSTYEEVALFSGHMSIVFNVAFSPDGTLIASASGWEDASVRLWDAATGAQKMVLDGGPHWVNSIAFSPDGKTLASTARHSGLRFWDTVTGEEKRVLRTLWDIELVAFSPDGATLASAVGFLNNTVRLWDLATGTEKLAIVLGDSESVVHIAFSPDGKTLAIVGSSSSNYNIYLCDPATGEKNKYSRDMTIELLVSHLVRTVRRSPVVISGEISLSASGMWRRVDHHTILPVIPEGSKILPSVRMEL